ncbi:MAG: AAA family ATPase [Candidatus Nanoarchaeia archaeon]
MIICVTGTIASGKGKVAELIRDKGFEHHSFSLEIRAVARERGIEINRTNLSKLGEALKKEKNRSVLGERVVEKLKKHPEKNFIIDGMRDLEELRCLRDYEKESGVRVVLLAVDAPQELRFKRLQSRKRHGDPETFEEFRKIDDREFKGGHGQEVGAVMKKADYAIDNSGTLEELEKQLDDIIMKER